MKKLIAITKTGAEFFHSKNNCFFASTRAETIADILNKNKYKISEGETWHVYDYDFMQDQYVINRININKNTGRLKITAI